MQSAAKHLARIVERSWRCEQDASLRSAWNPVQCRSCPRNCTLHIGAGHKCHCLLIDYQLAEWEGGPSGEASQETCQGIHRFSIRGGRMENESSGCLWVAGLSLFFGLGLAGVFFGLKKADGRF